MAFSIFLAMLALGTMRLKKNKTNFSLFINYCGTRIDNRQRPNLINCDPLTYHLVPSSGQDHFWTLHYS